MARRTRTTTEPPANLPRNAQDMTSEQVEEVVVWLQTNKTLAELRQHQRIHKDQIAYARQQGNDTVADSEMIRLDITTDALSRLVWGEPMAGVHTRVGREDTGGEPQQMRKRRAP